MKLKMFPLVIFLVLIALLACESTSALSGSPNPENDPVSGNTLKEPAVVAVPAPIEDVAVVSAGLFPRRYFVHFKSGLPDSCHKFDKSDVDRNGGVINIAVTNLKPRGPAECTDTRRMVNRVVALGSDFRAGDTYRVRVNAVPETLVARGIWAYKQISEKANKGLRTRSCRSQPGAHF